MNIDTGTSDENSLASDLLRGAKPIGDFIGEDEKRVYYLAERGYLPIGRIGATLIASKKALRAHFDRITQGAAEAAQPLTQPRISRRRPAKGRPSRKQTRPEAVEATA